MSRVPRHPEAFSLTAGPKRPKPVKEGEHLKRVRALPCVICGTTRGVEAAHVRYGSIYYGKAQSGLAQKPHDAWTLPLCVEHHRTGAEAQHKSNEAAWWRGHRIDPLTVCALLYVALSVRDYGAAETVIAAARARRVPYASQNIGWSSSDF